jgi:glycosyltransferase involved in cell wall biosynthesis
MGRTPGGGELQIALLAKSLALAGNEVVIIDPEGKEDFVSEEGIKIITVKGWEKGLWMLRTLTHRLPQFFSLLKEQNADIYYCRIRDFRHILVYWAARKVKAKFVLALASDLDILSFRMRCKHSYFTQRGDLWTIFSGFFIEILYPFLLHKSDVVFTQHIGQKAILDKWHINSIVNPNLIELNAIQTQKNPDRNEFAYVGSLARRKGFVQFFDIVKRCPQYKFKVIGQPRDRAGFVYFEKLKFFSNVTLLGRLDHSETINHIANSKALISTSPMEGFPNVFIESWAVGVPVVSLYVNPGSVLENKNLGYFANGNLDNLIRILGLFDTPSSIKSESAKYVENVHSLNKKKIEDINRIFQKIIQTE